GPVGEAEKGRVGGEVEPAARAHVAGLARRRRCQPHDEAERLAEVLIVVVAGDGQDGTASEQERLEDFLNVLDGAAQAIRTTQFAEKVTGDKQDVHRMILAVNGDALDVAADVEGAVNAAETVAQMPVGSVQNSHGPTIILSRSRAVEVSRSPGGLN